ncbi:hypothetical protein IPC1147_29240 [Pseudomonas aeruginosa]|uniref:hypothetical protein n=1 Tax=Pseudomonas aeruginosa TaxID=287 RepID=UPI0010014E52|nr:hypothetical protein [Pseudomonas aeruginosa]MBH8257465.1 hypothetical protein [Pseudomonas aeruginosa]MCV3907772.1 hypothetical protein [Pseudomonas aeruginosa]NPS39680.1 hypothetical protein [Pseudomonas aeruginosa]NPS89152.1 hypothetical protein [Pseudomonas aeruginosa]RRS17275.1 hypothetical protein IPC1107_29785 [Pseudomonas aeruginosa]
MNSLTIITVALSALAFGFLCVDAWKERKVKLKTILSALLVAAIAFLALESEHYQEEARSKADCQECQDKGQP